MSDATSKFEQIGSSYSSDIVNAVVKVLNQLPLNRQQQVLDFVEFLFDRDRALPNNSPQVEMFDRENKIALSSELKQEFAEWEAASDEDWLATEITLAKPTY